MCPPVWFDKPQSVILSEGMGTFAGTYQLEVVDSEGKAHRIFILGDRRNAHAFEDEKEFWKAWRKLRDEDGLYQPDWSRKAVNAAVAEFERIRNERD